MTDVAGPPMLPVRFSSLLIRKADAPPAVGADQSILAASSDMAQAFEIPRETGPCPSEFPNTFQIAAPGRPIPISWIDWLGIWVHLWLAASAQMMAHAKPAAGPISGSAICLRLVNPVGFDKTKPPAVFNVERPAINS